ncbi:MAG: fumarate hydratase C-terminal domain-containing protein [Clostridiales bacterium]|nr:fumarate hydratase C-terminal domain-containing protein [Clostridiales bacterium]
MRKLETSALREEINTLKAGDSVLLSGVIYTARDAAHARICSILKSGGELPFPLEDAVIYYAGPTPAPDGLPIGSCGPTTSVRMDAFTPALIENGIVATIGKGNRGSDVVAAMKKYGAVYFCAVGGAGAIAAKYVKKAEIIAFDELDCEAVRRLEIEDFPLIVGIDAAGNSILQ